ncbi:MAG: hypothetical protein AB1779_04455 [Candidatus Thermoplasmatota archaeon]
MDDLGLYFELSRITIFLLLIIVSIYVAYRTRFALERAYKKVATDLGLTFHKGGFPSSTIRTKYPSISGSYKGRAIAIYIYYDGSYYTRIELITKAVIPNSYHIYTETMLSKIGKAFGAQDIQIGDPLFDPLFMIKESKKTIEKELPPPPSPYYTPEQLKEWEYPILGGQQSLIARILDINVRRRMVRIAVRDFGDLYIESGKLMFSAPKIIKDYALIKELIFLLTTIALNCERISPAPLKDFAPQKFYYFKSYPHQKTFVDAV